MTTTDVPDYTITEPEEVRNHPPFEPTPAYEFGPKVTNNGAYPPVQMDLLMDLVTWAEGDQAFAERFTGWGRWDQASWGTFILRESLIEEAGLYYDEPAAGRQADIAVQGLIESAIKADTNLCGTAYCMAGQAVVQAGYRLVLESMTDAMNAEAAYASNCVPEYNTGRRNERGWPIWADVPGARHEDISDVAQNVLGLTPTEASRLFAADNDVELIKEIVNTVAADRLLPPPYPTVGFYDEADDDESYSDDDDDDDE